MPASSVDRQFMHRALELALQGQGHVEPNPMVGAVVVRDEQIVGEGWHQKFGGPHAEVHSLKTAGERAKGATLYVTLEPCCHTGKTPPCTEAILASGVRRVVIAHPDPFPEVDGRGIDRLAVAGIECTTGVLEPEAHDLLAPYLKLVTTGRPWVLAKWAMTLDGKIATHSGSSKWITGEESRAVVHQIRGRMDAIVVGSRTALADDPLLTARPPGPRTATRIVLGDISADSRLATTLTEAPLIVVRLGEPTPGRYDWLTEGGGELLVLETADHMSQVQAMLEELGRRRMTNVLFEGGGQVLGALFDAGVVDEVHAFVAPKIAGGNGAPSPVAGMGVSQMKSALSLTGVTIAQTGSDMYLRGRLPRPAVVGG